MTRRKDLTRRGTEGDRRVKSAQSTTNLTVEESLKENLRPG